MQKPKAHQEPFSFRFAFRKTTKGKKEILFTNNIEQGKNYVLLNKRFEDIFDAKELAGLHE